MKLQIRTLRSKRGNAKVRYSLKKSCFKRQWRKSKAESPLTLLAGKSHHFLLDLSCGKYRCSGKRQKAEKCLHCVGFNDS